MKRARNVPGIYRGVLLPAIGGKKWLSLAIWAFGVSLIWAVSALVLPAEAAFPHDHTVLTAELKKYVEGPLVHYRRWKEHPEGLNRYIALLSKMRVDEYAGLSEDEKKCLWINAYNALTIKIVLERYPIHGIKPYYPPDSLRQIPDVWEAYHFRVAGKEVNLYNIEHDIIRREFHDPRMHFAVVCAAKGCAALRPTAYVSTTLNQDLDAATARFLSNTKNIQYCPDAKLIRVSQLFRWFPLDFAQAAGFARIPFPPPSDDEIVASYVLTHAPAEIKQQFPDRHVRIIYMPYDWSLNDADAVPSASAEK